MGHMIEQKMLFILKIFIMLNNNLYIYVRKKWLKINTKLMYI